MFIGDTILLGGFKLVYERLDMYGLGAKFFDNGSDEDFILDGIHECSLDLLMGHVGRNSLEKRGERTKELEPAPEFYLLEVLLIWYTSSP